MDSVKDINKKTEGKKVMFAVFKDEVSGCGWNNLSEEEWDSYKAYRSTLDDVRGPTKYERPAVHMHEYGANEEGYWTAAHMVELTADFTILFKWRYPGHTMLLNVDWSSNHNAVSPTALTLPNMLVGWGEKGNKEISSKKIERECVNPDRSKIPAA
jgi:hypothetical protein